MSKMINLKKYKTIIASIMVFIVLDLSVLIFNFYISHQVAQDALLINVAGQQRVLTQRITKNLLEFERAYDKSKSHIDIIDDIKVSMMMFHSILNGFDKGGAVMIDDRKIWLDPVSDENARKAIVKAKPMWEIYKNYTADVLAEFEGRESIHEDVATIFFRESILKDVVLYATHNNLALLGVMNELVEAKEHVAESKVKTLRTIQSVAIIFAVINFFFIIFFALRNLRRRDVELEVATIELNSMLNTIDEGIFLLNSDLKISEQHSKKMEAIFNSTELSGRPLIPLLGDICQEFNCEGVSEYFTALFDHTKNMKMLDVLNPLQKVMVSIESEGSVFDDKKYLKFSYARIEADGEIERVLVRVLDVSSVVLREQQLEDERAKQFKQLRLMSALMNSNADMLPVFFQRSFSCFDRIGGILKAPVQGDSDLMDKLIRIDVLLGDFQVEAKGLDLDSLIDVSDDLQFELDKIKLKDNLSMEDFHELSVVLDDLISHTESIYKFSNKILAESGAKKVPLIKEEALGEMTWAHLSDFSEFVADKEGKKVEFTASGLNDHVLSKSMLRIVNSIIFQLIQHSVVVSIEDVSHRMKLKKSPFGVIDTRLVRKKVGGYYLTVRNDGGGIDVPSMKSIVDGYGTDGSSLSKISKKDLLILLFFSYLPEESASLTYSRSLLFGDELLAVFDRNKIKFDIKSVKGEGSVFEFMLPLDIS